MGIFDRFKNNKSTEMKKRSMIMVNSSDFAEWLLGGEYIPLTHNPEIVTACQSIAGLISTMTIHLMSNSEKGDIRINNELSKHIDIYPNKYMTRKAWLESIVMNMLLYGNGNSVVEPTTKDGLLDNLFPIPPSHISYVGDYKKYNIVIDGINRDPDELLHFTYNPDENYPWKGKGVTVLLKDIAENLAQAQVTEKGFMQSKWKPSIIVKVDGLVDEFSSPEGRAKLLEDYIETSSAGDPWLIPADQFSVEQIRPLSLSDLAINESVELNKKTVAAILGVPAFLLGVGSYNREEWDNFVNTKIRNIVKELEQEMTRKLLVNPKWYFKFNIRSLYAYDIKTVAEVYGNLYDKGIVSGNEVRDELSLSPKDGLDKLMVLENYLPIDQIDKQKKVVQGE